jgi:hypothetical protein
MNVKPYQPLAFFNIICVENQIALIKNLIIISNKNLERVSGGIYFPTE